MLLPKINLQTSEKIMAYLVFKAFEDTNLIFKNSFLLCYYLVTSEMHVPFNSWLFTTHEC